MPRLWPISMMVRTMVASFGRWWRRARRTGRSSACRWGTAAAPTATSSRCRNRRWRGARPAPRSSFSMPMVRFGSAISVVSVISSSSCSGDTPCRANTELQSQDEAGLPQLLQRQVQRDAARRRRPASLERAVVEADAVQHPLADAADEVVLLGQRDELRRRDVAVARQPPAQQRLGADDAAVGRCRPSACSRRRARRARCARFSLLFSISRSTAAAFISGE